LRFINNINRENKNIAILAGEESWSYSNLFNLVNEMNNSLPKKRKALILVVSSNNIETVISILLALLDLQTIMLINELTDEDYLKTIIDKYDPDYIWSNKKIKNSIYAYNNYYLVRRNNKPKPINPICSLLLSTSGSTGAPKYVRLSTHNLETNANSIVQYLSMTDKDSAITTLPLNYSYGLSILTTHFLIGGKLFLSKDSLISREFWTSFNNFRPSSFSGVPYQYRLLKKLNYNNMNWNSVRIMTQAGGNMDDKLVEEFSIFSKNNNIKLYIMYGQTEASPRMSYLEPQKVLYKFNSIGKALPGGKFEIIDLDTSKNKFPIGELVYYGENVMLGYSKSRKDLLKSDELNGKLFTGDIATIDEENDYTIIGRKDRMIKFFGLRINPIEIERELKLLGYKTIVFKQNDLLIIAVTSISDNIKIKNRLNKKFFIPKNSILIKLIKKIPRNSFGKIDYKKIMDL